MMNLWRLNIKTDSIERVDPKRFCIENGFLGIGWRVEQSGKLDWDRYYQLGKKEYYDEGDKGWWPAINAVKERMQQGDLCWTRDKFGIYYLGRVVGEWEYIDTEDHVAADVVNVRRCQWIKVGAVDAVPGKVVNSFISRRAAQRVHDESVEVYSQFLFNKLSGNDLFEPASVPMKLLTVVSADDCEDIVGAYLQKDGFVLVPSSCKRETAGYEYVLKHPDTGVTAVAQVKQGFNNLSPADYSTFKGQVYLLTTQGKYLGTIPENVHCLCPDEIEKFALKNRKILSDRVNNWLDILEEYGTVV